MKRAGCSKAWRIEAGRVQFAGHRRINTAERGKFWQKEQDRKQGPGITCTRQGRTLEDEGGVL